MACSYGRASIYIHMKRILASGFGILLFISAVGPVSALSVSDLQAQLQSVLAQLAQYQQGSSVPGAAPQTVVDTSGTLGEAPASCKVWYDGCNTCTRAYPGGPLSCTAVQCIWNAGSKCTEYFAPDVGTPRYCTLGSPILRRGASGTAVSAVQEFLRGEGILSAQATGYFGAATEAALKQWQSQQSIVSSGSAYTTGWGAVGPRTWAALKLRCSPIVGDDRDVHGCIGSAGYTWCAAKNKCLRSWEESCSPVSNGTLKASPASGTAPLVVTFSAQVNPTNDQLIADAGYYKLVFGDGQQYTFPCTDPSGTCRPPQTTHTYTSAGTYTAQLIHYGYFGLAGQNETIMDTARIEVSGGVTACTLQYAPVCGRPTGCANTCPPGAFCTMMCRLNDPQTYGNLCQLKAAGAEYLYDGPCVDAAANRPPTISGISGPTTLNVNQSGTWSVQASDPENQSLSYSITWGDEAVYGARMDATVSSPVFSQTSTFTHAYSQAGTYTVSVTVTDAQGKSAQTSTTVRVGSAPVACTMEYMPVCGQKTVCPACAASNPPCMAPCYSQQQTYGNTCTMNADGATFVHNGMCSGSVY